MDYEILVGTVIGIKQGFLKGSFKIMYCGMVNENTFALAPYVAIGYQGFSPNIYYSADAKVIQILDVTFDVIKVTPQYIVLGD